MNHLLQHSCSSNLHRTFWDFLQTLSNQQNSQSNRPGRHRFLRKLLTEDLPRLFVRPKKIYLDFQQGKAVGPVVADFKSEDTRGNEDHVGELSITLVDARKLPHIFFGKTDPYVILSLGDQVIRSKKNSQTTVIGRPGEPIWNQDFLMLVANPRKQKLNILVKDSLGFSDWTVGAGEVDLCSLEDTVPTDKIVALQGGWGVLGRSSSGEILLRLTYKAYVEDEEDDWTRVESVDADASDDELSDFYENNLCKQQQKESKDKESFVGVLAALIVSEEFQGIVATEAAASSKVGGGFPNDGSLTSKLQSRNGASKSLDLDPGGDAEVSRASAIVWFSVITGVLVLIAINMGGSSLFNP